MLVFKPLLLFAHSAHCKHAWIYLCGLICRLIFLVTGMGLLIAGVKYQHSLTSLLKQTLGAKENAQSKAKKAAIQGIRRNVGIIVVVVSKLVVSLWFSGC